MLTEIARRANCRADDVPMVYDLLELAYARGYAGRWPDGRFDQAADWTDGERIDRVAAVSGVDGGRLFALYRTAHAEGRAARRAADRRLN